MRSVFKRIKSTKANVRGNFEGETWERESIRPIVQSVQIAFSY